MTPPDVPVSGAVGLDRASAGLLETMILIREVEERLMALADEGHVDGFLHPCTGQEAIAAGVLSVRHPHEWVVSFYRGHGHAIASGVDLEALVSECLGRASGLCGGKGGSMHLADRANKLLGSSSIVGSQIPVAAGAALGEKTTRSGRAVVCFFGDGALGAGVAYETLSISVHLGLPLLLVCEDNGWQDHTPSERVRTTPPEDLLARLGVPTLTVDGNDATEVAAGSATAIAACRAGAGPAAIVAKTYLRDFHARSGSQPADDYRPATEVAMWRRRDPIAGHAARTGVSGPRLQELRGAARRRVDAAVTASLAQPFPGPSEARTNVTVARWGRP